MSQGASDLPDPLDKPPPPGPTASTDDLLAKMAGDEIDRLLADAEMARDAKPALPAEAAQAAIEALQQAGAKAPKSDQPGEQLATEDVDSATARKLDSLFEQLEQPKPAEPGLAPQASPAAPTQAASPPGESARGAPPAASAPSAARPSPIAGRAFSDSEKLDEELENLYQQLDGADRPAEPAAPAAAPAQKTEQAPPTAQPSRPAPPNTAELAAKTKSASPRATAQTPPDADASAQTGSDEKKALVAEILEAAASATRKEAAASTTRVPFYLRILIWINRPIDGCSDFVRNLIGKAAIATLLMSILTLAYVLIFRR